MFSSDLYIVLRVHGAAFVGGGIVQFHDKKHYVTLESFPYTKKSQYVPSNTVGGWSDCEQP